MKRALLHACLITLAAVPAVRAGTPAETNFKPCKGTTMNETNYDIRPTLAAFAPVELRVDASFLSGREKKVLRKLSEAAALMDEIFLRQACLRNAGIRDELARRRDARGKALLDFFLLNFGPWDTLRHDAPFLGTAERPKGAGFYPEDMTREDFERHLKENPADGKAFRSNFTVIRRKEGRLEAVPYSREYREFLEPAAKLLREAAELADSPSLKRYLQLRARDFLTDDYFESDTAWMDVTGTPIEVVIGPYEVYTDALFGFKAAFEAFVCVRNPGESAKLDKFKRHLDDLERNLPLAPEHQNFSRGKESPLLVVDEVRVGGDARPGVQTAAFNLPNDERVREAKGSKKVMLHNVMQAKFDQCLVPISERVLAPADRPRVNFGSYFDEILLHEICHGLGPGRITVNGRSTTVGAELKDLYAAVEECKADITGIWSLLYLMDHDVIPRRETDLAVTYLAGLFRSVRFGVGEAHGLGVMMQYNFLKQAGVIRYDPASRHYAVDPARFREGVRALAAAVLTVEAKGDCEGARKLVETYGKMPDEVRSTLEGLKDIPTDIRPSFPKL